MSEASTAAAGDVATLRTPTYLQPGGLVVSASEATITTILGSCVAVCLWDPDARVGGMNHFLLAHAPEGAATSARYGNFAVPMLITRLIGLGAHPRRMRAKVFGGACLARRTIPSAEHLGARNVEVATQVLATAGIPVVADDVLGEQGRKLIFHTDDGTAWVRKI